MNTVYTFKNAAAVVICPFCGQKEQISIACLERKSNQLELTCSCRCTYTVTLEFRENFRKEVSLCGSYHGPTGNTACGTGSLLVKNISACGMGIFFPDGHSFKEGDIFSVEFRLADGEPPLTKEVIVRFARDRYCGCEFLEKQVHRREIKNFLEI